MRIWISRGSEVPIREQIATQILLAIYSGELKPGEKLPSIRSLARRLSVHANTISATYRDLAERHWVEIRKGSGAYIRAVQENQEGEAALDRLVATLIRSARERGHSLSEIRARVDYWLDVEPPDHFLVVDEDVELRRILEYEIGSFTRFPVAGIGLDDCRKAGALAGALLVALRGRADAVRDALPEGYECHWLETHAVQNELQKYLRPLSDDTFVVVASRWPEFLRLARTILVAAGLSGEQLGFLDARNPRWKQGLRPATVVVTDALTGTGLPPRSRARSIIFPITAAPSLEALERYAAELGGT